MAFPKELTIIPMKFIRCEGLEANLPIPVPSARRAQYLTDV